MIEDAFIAVVTGALARSGFVLPAVNEARTFVFACRSLLAYAPVAAQLLDAGENSRAARFRFEHDRATYTVAHAVWRIALAICLDVAPTEVPLIAAPAGQPILPGTGLSTSLSHASDWVAVAVCRAATTGIDIEQEPSRVRLGDMIDTICTPAEVAQVMSLEAARRETALLALWTRKEALLKAFGVGLGVDPATIDAGTDDLVASPSMDGMFPACWIGSLDLPAGLVGAFAVPTGVVRVEQHSLVWD